MTETTMEEAERNLRPFSIADVRSVMVKHQLWLGGYIYEDSDGVHGKPADCINDPDFLNQVAYSVARFERLQPIGPSRKDCVGSYTLKHIFEQSWLSPSGERGYVSNGALLVAAYLMKFFVEPDKNSPNGTIFIKNSAVNRLQYANCVIHTGRNNHA